MNLYDKADWGEHLICLRGLTNACPYVNANPNLHYDEGVFLLGTTTATTNDLGV